MFRAGVCVTAILQLNNMKIKLLPRVYGKLTCLQQLTGSVRWSSSIRPAPLLTAAPVRALMDEQISIRGHFLPPHCPVTVCARMHSDEGDLWESFAHYNTNAGGTFSLSSDHSVGGSYLGCEPMGLFWGMQPAPGGREARQETKTTGWDQKRLWAVSPSRASWSQSNHPSPAHPAHDSCRQKWAGQKLKEVLKETEANFKFPLIHRLRKKNVETPYVVHVSLLEGHVSPCEDRTTELAALTAERWYLAPGVKRTEIRQNGIVGTLFIPPGPGPFPAMLDLWGMGGGLQEYRSSLLASRGFASLCLSYFGHKDLPGPTTRINVGDSYYKAAFQLLQNHHQVVSDRVGIIGLSFGCYLTLRIAAQLGVKPSCLVCINGPVGSTAAFSDLEGRTKEFDSFSKLCKYDDRGYVIFKDISLPANLPPQNIVKLENIDCPLVYVVGEDDLSASSSESADLNLLTMLSRPFLPVITTASLCSRRVKLIFTEGHMSFMVALEGSDIEETLRSVGKSHLFSRLSYPGAGHLIEPPYAPNARASMWTVKPKKLITLWGGHPAPHAAAQEDAWKKILEFLDKHLRG